MCVCVSVCVDEDEPATVGEQNRRADPLDGAASAGRPVAAENLPQTQQVVPPRRRRRRRRRSRRRLHGRADRPTPAHRSAALRLPVLRRRPLDLHHLRPHAARGACVLHGCQVVDVESATPFERPRYVTMTSLCTRLSKCYSLTPWPPYLFQFIFQKLLLLPPISFDISFQFMRSKRRKIDWDPFGGFRGTIPLCVECSFLGKFAKLASSVLLQWPFYLVCWICRFFTRNVERKSFFSFILSLKIAQPGRCSFFLTRKDLLDHSAARFFFQLWRKGPKRFFFQKKNEAFLFFCPHGRWTHESLKNKTKDNPSRRRTCDGFFRFRSPKRRARRRRRLRCCQAAD